MIKWLKGKKTYMVAGLMVLVTGLQLLTGDLTFQQFIMSEHITTLMEAAGFATLRAGVAKKIG